MIYIVVAGSHYYPGAGAGDWKGVYSDHDDAITRCEGLQNDWVYIIQVHPDGKYWQQIWR